MSSSARHLGDLVLAKFDSYPYWPAVIERCFWDDSAVHKQWKLAAGQAGPEDGDDDAAEPRIWCRFLEDDSANWVPVSKIKDFTPKTARRWQCRKKTKNYERQQAAIIAGEKLFNKRRAEPRSPASTDAGASDTGEHAFEKAPSEERAVAPGKRRYEPVEDSASAGPSPPRKTARAGARGDDDRADRQATQDTFASPRKLRVREEWADRYRLSVACARVPPPERAHVREQLSGKEFAEVIRSVRNHVADLRDALARVYRGKVDDETVAEGEERAAKAHGAISAVIVRLADCDVPLDDLRRHKAGKLVMGIVKDLGPLHGIRPAGDEVIARWRGMCAEYDGSAGQEGVKAEPDAAGSSPVEGGSA